MTTAYRRWADTRYAFMAVSRSHEHHGSIDASSLRMLLGEKLPQNLEKAARRMRKRLYARV